MPVEIGGLSLLKKLTRHDKGNIYIYIYVIYMLYIYNCVCTYILGERSSKSNYDNSKSLSLGGGYADVNGTSLSIVWHA